MKNISRNALRIFSRPVALLLCLSIGIGIGTATAKTIPSEKKLEQVSDLFMSQVSAGDTESALALISAYVGVDTAQFNERSSKLVLDMKRIEASAGKPLSFAKIDVQKVGEHFYKARYLLKFQQAALVWELNFYQPSEGWQLVDVTFNTNIDALFAH